eukprot:COSAG06_NODE_34901_length_467_cov_1.956522_1_plen_43_part_10
MGHCTEGQRAYSGDTAIHESSGFSQARAGEDDLIGVWKDMEEN